MNRAFFSAAIGASFLLVTASAQAEEGQMHVRLGDLNLQSEQGAQVALQRIRYSAAVFCESAAGKRPLEEYAQVNACLARMTGKAVTSLNAPLVTASFKGQPAAQTTVLASAGH